MPPKRKKDAKKISIEPPPTIEPDMLEVIEPEEPSKPLISAVTGQPFGPRVRYISEKQEEESTDDEPDSILRTSYNELNETNKELVAVAIGCAKVLDSLSSSPKVRDVLHKFGVVKLMERFICPSIISSQLQNVFRKAFETTDIISDVVRHHF